MYTIYKKHLYVNPNYDYIKGATIKEYDIKAAGYNILIAANLLSDEKIKYYDSLPKYKRNVKIGLLEKSNKKYSKAISEGLIKYRKLFFEANNIDENSVISIRRDAIFVANTRITKTQFDNIYFVPKNKYSSYYQLNKCDFLFSRRDDILHVKGINDNLLKLHEKYMLKFMKKLFALNEVSNKAACNYLYEFADKYRKKKLPLEYYRELDTGLFRIKDLKYNGRNVGVSYINYIDDIDINYNYMIYIVPLIGMIY